MQQYAGVFDEYLDGTWHDTCIIYNAAAASVSVSLRNRL